MKICIECKKPKSKDEFYRSYCKICFGKYQKEHYVKNKTNKKWYGYDAKYCAEYRKQNEDKLRKYNNDYKNERRKTDPLFKLKSNIGMSIRNSFRTHKFIKPKHTIEILGCNFEEFKQHLEKQFEPWMNWNNFGGRKVSKTNTNWDIDHIIPISSAKTEEDIIKLNHYTNLRPLCSYANRWIKRNKQCKNNSLE